MKNIKVKLFGIVLILLSIFLNPLSINHFTSSDRDPIINNIQTLFLEIILLSYGIFLIEKTALAKKEIILLTIIFVFCLFLTLALEFLIQALFLIGLIAIFVAFFFIKKDLFKKNKGEITLLLGVFLVLIVLMEIFARIYLISPLALLPQHGSSVVEFSKAGLLQKSEYPDVIYELKPNIDKEFMLKNIKTNSRGLIDKEYSTKKPLNTYRVVVIGDSMTMPLGIETDKAYHTILENEYNNESNLNYEFINFGVGGYSLSNYLGVIKYKALAYQPDLILVSFLPTNDFYVDELANMTIKKERTNGYLRLWTPKLLNHLLQNIKSTFQPRKQANYDTERINKLFFELKKLSESNNVNVTFVALLRKEEKQSYEREFNLLKNYTGEYGFDLIDTSYKFQNLSYGETKLFRSDNHGNEITNELFAEAIKENLKI